MADFRGDVRILEFNRKRGIVFLGGLVLVSCLVWSLRSRPADIDDDSPFPIPGSEVVGVVEVLNGSTIDGLARSVTRTLRIGGIDVVYFGTQRPVIDTTRVLIRRGDSTMAVIVRGFLKRGLVETSIDEGLLVDVTVLLGADYLQPESAVTP